MSDLLHTYRIGDCTVEVWGDCVRTILPHGTVVVAADSDMRRCIDHELAHTWIAVHYHRKWSPALWRKAISNLNGCTDYARDVVSDAQVAHEESIVLAFVASLTGDRRPATVGRVRGRDLMGVIGITGSRYGMSWAQWKEFWRIVHAESPDAVHHGDCVGVDAQCDHIARLFGVATEVHPPEDDRLRAFTGGAVVHVPKPYHDRNRDIVDASDHVVAFPAEMAEQPRGGTWYTIRYARSQGKRLTIVYSDGTVA